jgi:hypothetical protein
MFESIVSKITWSVRNAVRAVGAAFNCAPWFTSAVIVALFFLV